MNYLYSSTDESEESVSSKTFQNLPNTSQNVQSLDGSRSDNLKDFGTTLNFSRAFWNLPLDVSTQTENEPDARTDVDETLSSNDHNIDNMEYYERAFSVFHRISIRRRLLEGLSGLRRQTEPVISKHVNVGGLYSFLLLIPVLLVPASAIAVGAQYIGHCPGNWLLPYFILLIGLLSTTLMVYVMINQCSKPSAFGEKVLYRISKMFGSLIGILILIEIALLFNMRVSFDISSKNYCNSSFYFYVAFLNILAFITVIGGVIKFIHSVEFGKPSFASLEDDLGF